MPPETLEAVAPDGLRILTFLAMGTTISILAPEAEAESCARRDSMAFRRVGGGVEPLPLG